MSATIPTMLSRKGLEAPPVVTPPGPDPLTQALLDKVRPLLVEALDTVKGALVAVAILGGLVGGLVAFGLGALLSLVLR